MYYPPMGVGGCACVRVGGVEEGEEGGGGGASWRKQGVCEGV